MRAIFALAVLTLAGCDVSGDDAGKAPIAGPAPDPPQLWRVQSLDDAGRPGSALYVCADAAERGRVAEARPPVKGRLCADTTWQEPKRNDWVLSCVARGQSFTVSLATTGDRARDFRQEVALTPLLFHPVLGPVAMRESRRLRLVGACPARWRIGDQARAGQRPRRRRDDG